jgi:hypothetical protein
MRRIFGVLAVWALTVAQGSACRAHDLKVLVSRLVAAPGDQDTIYVSYGHVLPVDSPIDADWLKDYHVVTPSGSISHLVKEGISLQANVLHPE